MWNSNQSQHWIECGEMKRDSPASEWAWSDGLQYNTLTRLCPNIMQLNQLLKSSLIILPYKKMEGRDTHEVVFYNILHWIK